MRGRAGSCRWLATIGNILFFHVAVELNICHGETRSFLLGGAAAISRGMRERGDRISGGPGFRSSPSGSPANVTRGTANILRSLLLFFLFRVEKFERVVARIRIRPGLWRAINNKAMEKKNFGSPFLLFLLVAW